MIPYGGDAQRNAIVQALMQVANPPPATGMPGNQMGSTRPPGVLAPPMPGAGGGLPGVGGIPGGGIGGVGTPSPQAASPAGNANPQPFMPPAGSYAPQSPRQVMPPQIGGAPLGPLPNTSNMVGVPPPGVGQLPGTQMPFPDPNRGF